MRIFDQTGAEDAAGAFGRGIAVGGGALASPSGEVTTGEVAAQNRVIFTCSTLIAASTGIAAVKLDALGPIT